MKFSFNVWAAEVERVLARKSPADAAAFRELANEVPRAHRDGVLGRHQAKSLLDAIGGDIPGAWWVKNLADSRWEVGP